MSAQRLVFLDSLAQSSESLSKSTEANLPSPSREPAKCIRRFKQLQIEAYAQSARAELAVYL